MVRSIRTRLLGVAVLCVSATLVGCGDDKVSNPKVKGDTPGLQERPAPNSPGGVAEPPVKGKAAGVPGAQTGVQ